MSDFEDGEIDFSAKINFQDDVDELDEDLLDKEAEKLLEVNEIKFIGPKPIHFCDNFYLLQSPRDFNLNAKESKKINLETRIQFEKNFAELFVTPNLLKEDISYCGSGLIDTNYRGPLIVCLTNNSKIQKCFKKGSIIAVLHLQQRSYADVVQVRRKSDAAKTEKKEKKKKRTKTEKKDVQKRRASVDPPIEIDEYFTATKQQRQTNVYTQTNVENETVISWESLPTNNKASLVRAYDDDVAFDIQLNELAVPQIKILPDERRQIPLGIKLNIPSGWYGQILSRSGLAFTHGIRLLGSGRISSKFKGQISVLLHNASPVPYFLKPGARIAQMIFRKDEKYHLVHMIDKNAFNKDTSRGEGGFGSTGYY